MLEIEIVNNINNYLNDNGIRFSNELRMGIGIPDISFNIGASKHLKLMDDYYLLSILEYINRKFHTTFDEIKNEFLLAMNRVKKYVSVLDKMKFVRIKDETVQSVKNMFSVKLGTIVSIEAKLRNWKEAYLQAQRYLCFSDYAYIAMPNTHIKNIEQDIFTESGIGILSVDNENKKIVEVLSARKSESCEFMLKYLITSKIIEKNDQKETRYLRKNIFSYLY